MPLIRIKFTFALDAQAFPLISVPMSVNSTMCVECLQFLFFSEILPRFSSSLFASRIHNDMEGFFFPCGCLKVLVK